MQVSVRVWQFAFDAAKLGEPDRRTNNAPVNAAPGYFNALMISPSFIELAVIASVSGCRRSRLT
jgi:hypothetical protein